MDELDGSIGVRVDLARAHMAYADLKVKLKGQTTSGSLSFAVEYEGDREPQHDLGDGIFWPAIQLDPHCDWLSSSSDTELVSLREYNASR